MHREITLRKDFFGEATLSSVYLGGGTPSILTAAELGDLFTHIYATFKISPAAEITLEANPDDLSKEKLEAWAAHELPINRLSIGIQSFSEKDLQLMNRAHNAKEAEDCVALARAYGYDMLTVDLIYGAPSTSDTQWEANVRKVLEWGVPHLSCYALTVEPRTALAHQIAKGTHPIVDPDKAARQFEQLLALINEYGYEQYEISNFAKGGAYAQHNTGYWQGNKYLGIGPSAHSYDGKHRMWNVANNAQYIRALAKENTTVVLTDFQDVEELTATDRYNEYVMTALRTKWGVDVDQLTKQEQDHFNAEVQQFVDRGLIEISNKKCFILTPAGRLFADGIASDLFL